MNKKKSIDSEVTESRRFSSIYIIPVEIFVFRISSYCNLQSLRSFCQSCRCFRRIQRNMEASFFRNISEVISSRRRMFQENNDNWKEIRNRLSNSEKEEMYEELRILNYLGYYYSDCLTDERIKRIRQVTSLGGSVFKEGNGCRPFCGGKIYAQIAFDIIDCRTHLDLENARKLLEIIKLQTSTVLEGKLGHYALWDSKQSDDHFYKEGPIEEIFGFQIGDSLGSICRKSESTEYRDEYFGIILEMLRCFRDGGVILSSPSQLIEFIRAVYPKLTYLINTGEKAAYNYYGRIDGRKYETGLDFTTEQSEWMKRKVIEFIEFLVIENGLNPFEYQTKSYRRCGWNKTLFSLDDPITNPFIEIFRRKELIDLLIPKIMFFTQHLLISYNEDDQHETELTKTVSNLLNRDMNIVLSTIEGRKMMSRILGYRNLTNKIFYLNEQEENKNERLDFMFELVRRKERKMIKNVLVRVSKKKKNEKDYLEVLKKMKRKGTEETILDVLRSCSGKKERLFGLFKKYGFV